MTPHPTSFETVPAIDALLDTLSHPIRRLTIRYFERRTGPEATLDELVAYITAVRCSDASDEVRIQLVHNHLPKLADREWLEYNHETGEIRYHGHEAAGLLLGDVRAIF